MADTAQPGAGLPAIEQFFLKCMLSIGRSFLSDAWTLNQFQRTTAEISTIINDDDIDLLSQQYQIPRLQGIEESSLNWSVLMVLDHLNQVNTGSVEIMRALKSGNQPFAPVRIENFKPDDDVGEEACDAFRSGNQRYWSFVKSHMPLHTTLTFPHPWFGELDGHGWHLLATVHQKIHLRQIYKIRAMIGVA